MAKAKATDDSAARPSFSRHGLTKTPEYQSWRAMRARCQNSKHKAFKDYGGRGINVCERWAKFENFYLDMGPRPLDTSLDRYPNKNGNYEPTNCRWATRKEQMRNKRTTRFVTLNGQAMPISQAAEICGISLARVKARLRNGWSHNLALQTPINRRLSRYGTSSYFKSAAGNTAAVKTKRSSST